MTTKMIIGQNLQITKVMIGQRLQDHSLEIVLNSIKITLKRFNDTERRGDT